MAFTRVEQAPPREDHDDGSWVVNTPRSPVPTWLHLLVLQLKPSLSGLRAPEHLIFISPPPCWFLSRRRDGDARYRSLVGRGVLITPPFRPFCRSVGVHSTIQPCRADSLTPKYEALPRKRL